jgi:hypothetical protein
MSADTTRAALSWSMIFAIGVAMLAWSWGTWPNAFVDFGRELYVPWRLAEGEVLYRDIAWFNGPLSAYSNALLFSVFGPGLLVLVIANAIDVALLVVILHALIRRVGDRLAAATACVVFLVLFAFNRIDSIGNDNYLTPYSHEATQGLALSLLAFLAFAAWRERPLRAAAASGALLGLVALTKAEIFLAAAAGLAVALVLEALMQRRAGHRTRSLLVVATFAGSLLVPVAISFGSLSLAMSPTAALHGTLGAWTAVFGSEVTSQYFYRATMGLVGIDENVTRVFEWFLAYAAVILPITLVCLQIRPSNHPPRSRPTQWLLVGGAFVGVGVVVVLLGQTFDASWPELLRPLPLLMVGLTAGSALFGLRQPTDPATERPDAVLRTALLVFATLLLAKVVLRVRLDQYGFALAMPATMLVIAAGLAWLPRWISLRWGDANLARAAVLGVVAAVMLSLLPTIGLRFAERSEPIGSGRDAFLSDEVTAPVLRDTLAALAERPDDTLAVIPEGVMLNYLSRRVNPTGHVNFMPPELLIFGEESIVAAFQRNPPDTIVLTHKDTREYGVGFFGRGYGRSLGRWVSENYKPVALFGDVPLRPESRFGTQVLVRRGATERATR